MMGLAKTVRENFGDGVQALKTAAAEAKGGKTPEPKQEQRQMYRCGNCGTEFTLPQQEFAEVKCPQCGRTYTKAEIEAA